MKVYDRMAGNLGIGPSEKISKEETLKAIPNLDEKGLLGGVIYYDGQFDDSRLAINLAQTAVENGAVVLNYAKAIDFIKDSDGLLNGLVFEDMETNKQFYVKGKTVINAAGVFSDEIKIIDDTKTKPPIINTNAAIILKHSILFPFLAKFRKNISHKKAAHTASYNKNYIPHLQDSLQGFFKVSLDS